MGKLVTTGKGKKEVLDNARLETLLMEVKKWARSRGVFEDVIKKQSGGEVPETLLSMFSGGKYKTSKDYKHPNQQGGIYIPIENLSKIYKNAHPHGK